MKKFLYTFFYGYLSFKYRRLIRTPIILSTIILIGSGVIIGLDRPFPNKEYIRELYEKYPLYVTPENKYYSIKESEENWSDSLQIYLDNGTLKKLNISFEDFYKGLWDDKELISTISRNVNKEKGYTDYSDYDFKRYNLDLIENSERFEDLIVISIFVSIGLFFSFLLSFLIEPFVIDKKNNKSKIDDSDYEPKNKETEIEIEKIFENTTYNQTTTNNKGSVFFNYFKFNNEYITGFSYLNRMLVSVFTSIIFGLGILLMLSTIYKRSKSLGYTKTLSIINCIIIPISFILNVTISETERKFGVSDDILMTIVPLVLLIPHMILLFKNGTRKKMGKFQIRT